MSEETQITRALISVSDKEGLVEFAQGLAKHKVRILSTGGSAKMLRDAGIAVTDVSDHTGFPEIMDGRVKTLHPTIHGGILAVRENQKHRVAMESHGIAPIDLVVVNLYPFVETVASGADYDTCIENIDIGGPAMIRAAAKNHKDVTIVTDPAEYASVLKDMDENNGATTIELRSFLAREAYARTSSYDSAITNWLAGEQGEAWPKRVTVPGRRQQILRYGENPHQEAALYRTSPERKGVTTAEQLQGKELSFNNLNDADAAFELVSEFDKPAVVIVKHANPCGVAQANSLIDAWKPALDCDPTSAFGGIVAVNRELDADLAKELTELFLEVVIAPAITDDAKEVLADKKNVRVLVTGGMPDPVDKSVTWRTLSGGLLAQSRDNGVITRDDCKVVTKREPTEKEWEDMLFAWKVAKHVKSNAIVYTRDQSTVGIGAGQMSRIDSSKIAASKSAEHKGTENSVVASDAFFPFADGLIAAVAAGATAAIHPGGSMRDEEVIKAADEAGIAMVYTGMRHFKH
ncbi:bifunctional phosphoribosylaminoimidazolecarboxamide formyltransferase/IMP cyclohydrolase [Curvivirga aplysinae]|uniref:bifunctional phosphoribosylaminoimidazolecarboxamide formyltransferase/IMP cyclohydrolase n=1 Tax=Curvivirga aplysinae TaxID=2529852 RepID=UPI0012BB9165|nr:bifunctional phosphoribosylaminoimidazolecarboxamide formyltransferase/IMP cyclohydrolase [Curvivirga aplysinae]MTI09303.1 bifunctional phosphoribosylaminoimidazolecarboxamide formyltransferase/IMP cyclohydrolase [Curvivirga aplysinae]